MITILFQRKGGAGKSTLAAQLSARLAGAGESVAIIDTDPQGTISNWSVYRKEREGVPEIKFVATKHGSDLDYAIAQMKAKYSHVIVDLQGGDSKENRATLEHADKIIIPFKASQPDCDNLPYIHEMMEKLKTKKPKLEIHFVLNEAHFSRAKVPEIDQARESFAIYKLRPLTTVIHDRKAYRDSMSTGLGASELKDKKAKAEIEGLWSEIYRTPRQSQNSAKRKA